MRAGRYSGYGTAGFEPASLCGKQQFTCDCRSIASRFSTKKARPSLVRHALLLSAPPHQRP